MKKKPQSCRQGIGFFMLIFMSAIGDANIFALIGWLLVSVVVPYGGKAFDFQYKRQPRFVAGCGKQQQPSEKQRQYKHLKFGRLSFFRTASEPAEKGGSFAVRLPVFCCLPDARRRS